MKSCLIFLGLICCLFIVYSCSSDSEAPTITITEPNDDDTIRVHTTVISADANDNKDVEYVEFFAENTLVGSDSSAPYETNWSIASYNDLEVLSIHGRAYDFAENVGQSDVITVTVITRGMVTNTRTDSVIIYDGTWAELSVPIVDAPDSAVVDSIVVTVTILHYEIDDVDVYLQSPASTEHQLWDNNFVSPTDTISTTAFTDEDVNGTWLLRIFDEDNNLLGGYAKDFVLDIYWKF